MGPPAQGTGPKAPCPCASGGGRGQAGRGTRGARAGQKLTFRDIYGLSRRAVLCAWAEPMRAQVCLLFDRSSPAVARRNITATVSAVSLRTSRVRLGDMPSVRPLFDTSLDRYKT